MIIDNLEIILLQISKGSKILNFQSKSTCYDATIVSIVCAFATRLLRIVCSKRVASACRFGKNPRKSGNLIQNVLSVN